MELKEKFGGEHISTQTNVTSKSSVDAMIQTGILEATGLRSGEYKQVLAYTRGITVEKLREGYKKVSIPLGRIGKLSEVANTVCFLASGRTSYIHGTVINVSSGKSRA